MAELPSDEPAPAEPVQAQPEPADPPPELPAMLLRPDPGSVGDHFEGSEKPDPERTIYLTHKSEER